MRSNLLTFLLVIALISGIFPFYPGVAYAQAPTPTYPVQPLSSQNFVVHATSQQIASSPAEAIPGPSAAENWTTIISEDFEGDFPGSWELFSSGPPEFTWGKRSCRSYLGSYSGWGVGGGSDGALLACNSDYPNSVTGWMVYGPFSLADAIAADLSYKLWLNSENDYDGIYQLASIDDTDYYGTYLTGNSNGWVDATLDLTNVNTIGNLMGQPQVWIALVFESDNMNTASEGAYADNIILRQNLAVPPPPPEPFTKSSPGTGSPAISTNPTLSWISSTNAASYEYCYDTSNDNDCSSPSSWMSAGANTSAGLTGLAYSTTYYWQVRAVNSSGTTYADGDPTAYWSFTTQAPVPPGSFNKIAPGAGSTSVSTSPTISWSASPGAGGYEYCYDSSNDNNCSSWISAGVSSSAALSGLAYNTTYYWQVHAANGSGTTYADGDPANYWSFTTQAPLPPGVILVQVNGETSGTCGTAWVSACDLQYALQSVAVSGDELWVAAGTYTPTTSIDRFATFQLRSGIAVYGGFAGSESMRDARNYTTNITILSGNIGDPTSSDDNSYHVVTGSGTDTTAILDGFTITGGNADLYYESPHYLGAGVFNAYGSPIFSNLIISNNTALDLYGSGGGMYNNNSNPVLTNVIFSNNSVSYDGGGMLNVSSNPSLTNVTFDGNSATGSLCGTGTCGRGGGIENSSSNPTLTNVTFSNNWAHYYGGGIYVNGTSPMTHVLFYNNSARFGGGIYGGGNITLTDVVFDHNTATDYGGGMDSSGSPTFNKVTFKNNTASRGGGIYIYSGSPSFTNVSFIGNNAGMGGGLSSVTGTSAPMLTNVTFNGNSATYYGGAVYKSADITGDGYLTIRNSILWGNSSPEGSELYEFPYTATISDSIVQGGFANGTGIITSDPRLGAPSDWGGNSPTVPLLPGSSAIDAANPANCPAKDQRGMSRVGTCDIGAFESQGFTLAITGGNNQATNPGAPFSNPLKVSVAANNAGEPVNGGIIIYSAPPSGASVNTKTQTITIAGGSASASETANGTSGSYQVNVGAPGTNTVIFNLTNGYKKNTAIQLISTPNPSILGQSVQFTATVTATLGTATGTVTFYDTGTLIGSGSVNASGIATLTLSTLTIGSHSITAQYGGDMNYNGSMSGIYVQSVQNDCQQCSYRLFVPLIVK